MSVRIGLVISTSKCPKLNSSLPTATQEASQIAKTLQKLKFDHVELVTDPDIHQLTFAIDKVNSKISEHRIDGTDIIYFLYFIGETVTTSSGNTYITATDTDPTVSSKIPCIQEMVSNYSKYGSFFDVMVAVIDSTGKLMDKPPKNTLLAFSGRKDNNNTSFSSVLNENLTFNGSVDQMMERVVKQAHGNTAQYQSNQVQDLNL